jgi:hypothetical protein
MCECERIFTACRTGGTWGRRARFMVQAVFRIKMEWTEDMDIMIAFTICFAAMMFKKQLIRRSTVQVVL